MTVSEYDDLKQRFEILLQIVEDTNRDVLNDDNVSVDELEEQANVLYEAIQNADGKTARDLQPLLGKVVTALDELSQNIRARNLTRAES